MVLLISVRLRIDPDRVPSPFAFNLRRPLRVRVAQLSLLLCGNIGIASKLMVSDGTI